ncbi:MAG: peptidoglycan/LPS O-acetylase OafA/YrhL [Cryomorphaceae bacterium]|jgi:peptidoglycan/LPS O-acetylase OafA/YrhL
MNYRTDIQILRGLSVLVVVLYHLNIGAVNSGFLGVDIFFVISGFLMAVLYFPPGSTSNALDTKIIRAFLARRAQRILPAYFFIIIAVLIYGYFALHNAEYRALTQHSIFSAFLIPNVGDWLQASYFDANNFRPLLHLWSLGVEAQFYLVVPIIFAVFTRSKTLLIALSVLSLVACLAFAGRSTSSAFFLLPFRLWEFMLGFLCAALLTKGGNISKHRPLLGSFAFIGLMIISAIEFGEGLRHPGFIALISCVLAGTVLATGLPKEFEQGLLGRSLETLGKYSYSVYVVHYPIILLFIYQPFSGTDYHFIASLDLLALVTLIIVASVLCYHLIESPMRKGVFYKPKPIIAVMAVVVVSLGAYSLNAQQLASYTAEQRRVADAVYDRTQFRCGSVFELMQPLAQSCEVGEQPQSPTHNYLLIGNSHADSLKTILSELAFKHSSGLRIWKDNFPLGWGKTTAENVSAEVAKYNIDAVIVHQSRDTLRKAQLEALIAAANRDGFQIHYIDPIPVWDNNVPKMVWDWLELEVEMPKRTIGQHHELNFFELSTLNSISDPSLNRILISYKTCGYGCKIVNQEGWPLYYDSHHLNLTGAAWLAPALTKIFKEAD